MGAGLWVFVFVSAFAGSFLSSTTAQQSPFESKTYERGDLKVTVGQPRMILRGPMFPWGMLFDDGSILIISSSVEEGGPPAYVRSTDRGETWRPFKPPAGYCIPNVQLPDGTAFNASSIPPPIKDRPGYYQTGRYESNDRGHSWKYVSHVASLRDLEGPAAAAMKSGWRTWGHCESTLAEVGDGRLVCVMRTLNDDLQPLIGPATDTYRDLIHTLRGADIYKGSLNLPEDKHYSLSPPTTHLLICFSDDGGEHWTKPAAMREARGCMPQLASDGKILALSAGAQHYPRWGNGIVFSQDWGRTWTDLINFAPFFTSGYGALLPIGPGRFLAIFDYAAPQPWKDHAAHWVGVVDIEVARR